MPTPRGARGPLPTRIRPIHPWTKGRSKARTKRLNPIMELNKNILKRFPKINQWPIHLTKQRRMPLRRRLRSLVRALKFRRLWCSNSRWRCSRTFWIAWCKWEEQVRIPRWAICYSNRCCSNSKSMLPRPLERIGPWMSSKLRSRRKQLPPWQWASVVWIRIPILSLQDLVRLLHLTLIIISWQTEMMTKSIYLMKNFKKVCPIRRGESSTLWSYQLIKLIWFDRKNSRNEEWNTSKRCEPATNI